MRRSAAAIVLLFSLAGCASQTVPDTPVVPVPEVSQSSETPAAAPATEGTEAADKYFAALVTNDPDTMEEGQQYAAKGSVASAYLRHLASVEGALLDGGSASEPDELTSDAGVWGYCPSGEEPDSKRCAKWANAEFSGGLLSRFTVNGVVIDKRISRGSGDKIKSSAADVEFVTAYQTVQGKAVTVTLEIKAKQNLTLNLFGAKYRGPDGRQATATDAAGPTDLEKNSSTRAYVSFKGAKPGGVVTLELYDSGYNSKFIKIKTA